MRKRLVLLLAIMITMVAAAPPGLDAHCQIPCGIYDDEVRFKLLTEHVTTVEKSMTEIVALSAKESPNFNQLVRWVNNKEEHADKLMLIITQYFMAQRIKEVLPGVPEHDAYVKKISLLHGILRTAMKCKQTTAPADTDTLSKMIEEFKELYLGGQIH